MLRSGFIQLLLLFSDWALAKVDKFENCFPALIPKYLDNRSRQCVALKPASVFSSTRLWRPAPRSRHQQLKLSVSAQENPCQNLIRKTSDLRLSYSFLMSLCSFLFSLKQNNGDIMFLCDFTCWVNNNWTPQLPRSFSSSVASALLCVFHQGCGSRTPHADKTATIPCSIYNVWRVEDTSPTLNQHSFFGNLLI